MPKYQLDDESPNSDPKAWHWIASNAVVVGRVRLGDRVGVWFGAIIRGDNEEIVIGSGTNIQDGVVIHSDPGSPCQIGENCTIGHNAIIHGCTVGDGTLVGMGATVLNDVKLGKGCLVGANALLTQGSEYPDNSLIVGAPAKAIRILDEEAIAALRETADRYVENARRFESGLKSLD